MWLPGCGVAISPAPPQARRIRVEGLSWLTAYRRIAVWEVESLADPSALSNRQKRHLIQPMLFAGQLPPLKMDEEDSETRT